MDNQKGMYKEPIRIDSESITVRVIKTRLVASDWFRGWDEFSRPIIEQGIA